MTCDVFQEMSWSNDRHIRQMGSEMTNWCLSMDKLTTEQRKNLYMINFQTKKEYSIKITYRSLYLFWHGWIMSSTSFDWMGSVQWLILAIKFGKADTSAYRVMSNDCFSICIANINLSGLQQLFQLLYLCVMTGVAFKCKHSWIKFSSFYLYC